ncbi:Asp-tRNA(Asn)/Glu-tRNA(Gln) amidotransferase subunit GatB [Mycoplasma phocoeninasale]|uniref:Aspartyl/glutamyl-tRNA(Asn/Gln) amidotransferase subunit B n=1 Tax=Mycoplasma phocoeninasale TaxID=2726117 RepID=A0A858U221_9MOLU|nr:Asp-tRNA(Asn)/Glu-tRNA(Gln) amidotransferase subunit GatB [Mycoplasma phocoeninasale]MBN0970953.1 Asp-tRNA(Asn)/Glu-tRNA(Gln) amidotransferase subunit GatB [Mycoplasma phocoeninasale]QJG66510.1 Asp-tRNA(Asn)/Glu-tRNA(Gln) amidotransferase subunit GatB [Mycoplasma phocoeninasale]
MHKDWEMVIGIEIHLELNTKTKMFSPVENSFGKEVNQMVSNIDLAYPGTLPLVNSGAIIKGIKLAKALNMEIDKLIRFDRKNYFYPDLTKGYQITQQFNPIGKNGSIKIKVDNQWKDIAIERIHLEEDTAKSIHDGEFTKINYNRAGIPLIEIVSTPSIHSAREAVAYVEAIRQTALSLNISDAKMNEGSLRTDVNLSIRPKDSNELRTRVEIKNLNSLSNVEKAIEYEANQQFESYQANKSIEQCTKRFDEASEITVMMRSKSDALDYKYFPDPNIPYIALDDELIDSVNIEETPFQKEMRYISLGLNQMQINQLLNNTEYANYLDKISSSDRRKTTNLFFSEIISYLNLAKKGISEFNLSANEASELFNLVIDGKINKADVKKIIEIKDREKNSIMKIIEDNNFMIKESNVSLDEVIDSILEENPDLESTFIKNADKAKKFLAGQIMKKTMGKAKMDEINQKITERFK